MGFLESGGNETKNFVNPISSTASTKPNLMGGFLGKTCLKYLRDKVREVFFWRVPFSVLPKGTKYA